MHTEHKREDPLVDMGYEVRDLNLTGIRNVAICFSIFAVGCFGIVALWLAYFGPDMSSTLNEKKKIPSPALQTDISVLSDISTFRQEETSRLKSTGKNADGSYHIPLDQAINIVASRGLPKTETSVPAQSPGNTIKQNALAPGEHAAPADTAPPVPEGHIPSDTGAPVTGQ